MKPFNGNFKLVLLVLLWVFIACNGTAQSFKKMPDGNWWTLSNLNMDIAGSYCYNDSIANCQKYGRLYTWEAAQKVCSLFGEGWHLPSTTDWHNLLGQFGGAFQDSTNNGQNAFKQLLRTKKPTFGMTLGGNRNTDGTYARIEAHGFYWTSTSFDENSAGFLNFANGRKVLFLQPDMEKNDAISVRCIKNSQ